MYPVIVPVIPMSKTHKAPNREEKGIPVVTVPPFELINPTKPAKGKNVAQIDRPKRIPPN